MRLPRPPRGAPTLSAASPRVLISTERAPPSKHRRRSPARTTSPSATSPPAPAPRPRCAPASLARSSPGRPTRSSRGSSGSATSTTRPTRGRTPARSSPRDGSARGSPSGGCSSPAWTGGARARRSPRRSPRRARARGRRPSAAPSRRSAPGPPASPGSTTARAASSPDSCSGAASPGAPWRACSACTRTGDPGAAPDLAPALQAGLCYSPRPMRRSLAAALLLVLAACSSKHVSFSGEAKLRPTAEENYQAGLELLKGDNWQDAQKFFEYVRTKFPFTKYAALSDLRLADAKYGQGLHSEAADAYSQFIQLHPSHENVDYADGRLAAHEWYVAEYYFKHRHYAGAAGRYETLVDKFPGSRHEPEALLKLARACVAIEEKHRARTALQKLIVKHPQDPLRPEAERMLTSLR